MSRKKPKELRRERRVSQHGCWEHLIVAPLYVAFQANLGTLLRTCDAVGACMAVPNTDHYQNALNKGEARLEKRPHIHWTQHKEKWIIQQKEQGWKILGVELADDAIPLTRLEPARDKTVILLGHEHYGLPIEAWPLLDESVEIPMIGMGASLNVAVAGSLVLYRLAGLS